jgi:hypothetical protein
MRSPTANAPRKASKRVQVHILRRDYWLCRWCGCPVIFAPAMKYLAKLIGQSDVAVPPAYHHDHWTRKDAPLLDWMGAVFDHVDAYSHEGATDPSNLVTACNKCNALKSAMLPEDFRKLRPLRPVKGKYGEPKDWDGLSSLFIMQVERTPQGATASEREWLRALRSPIENRLDEPPAVPVEAL